MIRSGSGSLRPRALAAYASVGVPEAMLLYCASLVIPGVYAELGVPTAVLGTVMVVARLFDAISDPVIGYLSDRSLRWFGSRKPWILAGAVVSALAAVYLYTPEPGVTGAYYFGWTLCLYLGWTMAIIPYDAWGADISSDYRERSRIFAYRGIAYYLGSFLFLCTPLLGLSNSGGFDSTVLQFNAIMVGGLYVLTLPIAFLWGPQARKGQEHRPLGLWRTVANIRANRPLRLYLAVYSINGIGLGVFLALSYIYVVDYLGLPDAFAPILIVYALVNLVAVPLWMGVIGRLGRHRAWALGALADALIYPCLIPLAPGARSFVPVLLLIGLSGAADAVVRITADGILGDIIDYDELKTGQRRAANFYALKSLVTKANVALGGGLAFLLIGWFGFDPAATSHSDGARMGFVLTMFVIPAVLSGLAGLLIWRFPLDRRRAGIVKRRLDARAARLNDRPSPQ